MRRPELLDLDHRSPALARLDMRDVHVDAARGRAQMPAGLDHEVRQLRAPASRRAV